METMLVREKQVYIFINTIPGYGCFSSGLHSYLDFTVVKCTKYDIPTRHQQHVA